MMPGKSLCMKCGSWTVSETAGLGGAVSIKKTTTLDQVSAAAVERIVTGGPWDAAWGGGVVPTSITLMGGAAGAGKTTLLLQLSSIIAQITGRRSYYLSAEQVPGELRITADRLKITNIERLRVLAEFGSGAEIEEELLKDDPPGMMILDSISSLCGKDVHAAISICKRYKGYAAKYKAPAFLISHMTKEGDFAGLMALQHEVDTLVTLFPEEDGSRHLKAWKNRFGSTHQEHKLMMTETGLAAMPAPPERKGRSRIVVPEDLAEELAREMPGVPIIGSKDAPKPPPPRDLVKVKKGGSGKMERVEDDKARAAKPRVAKPPRAEAIEGEALKRKRTPMPRTAKAERERKTTRTAATAASKLKATKKRKEDRPDARR